VTIIGIGFPFQKGSQSFPETKTDVDVVEDNIRRILSTRKGERPMRPEEGSNVYDFVFESIGALLNARMDNEVRQSLARGEPRATVLGVYVTEELRPDGASNLVVTIDWAFNREYRQTAITYPSSGAS